MNLYAKYEQDMIRLFNGGLSSRVIASMLGCSKTTVLHYLHANGIDCTATEYGLGQIYLIRYKGTPIYIGCTTLSLDRRLKAHLSKAVERIGRFARFLIDEEVTEDELEITCLLDNVPIDDLFDVERKTIYKYSIDYELLNDVHNNIQTKGTNYGN